MMPKNFATAALITSSVLVTACQSTTSQTSDGPALSSDQPYQRYEVLAPAREVNSEEAVNFIRAQSELEQSRKASEDKSSATRNHPALAVGEGQTFSALTIRERESLLSVANRVMGAANFTRLIYDLGKSAPSPDQVEARARVKVSGATLFGEIASTYAEQFPGLQLFAAYDGDGHALVISDKGYPRWATLMIYDVQPGTLADNVRDLAKSIGWRMPDHLWTTDNFPIPSGYPVVIERDNPRQAITSLLREYPAQAQLNQNTATITVVPRPHP